MLKIISQPPVKDYVPYSWGSLVHVKKEHYKALSHYFVALGILEHKGGEFSNKTLETLQFLHEEDEDKAATMTLIEIRVPKNQNERRYLGKLIIAFGDVEVRQRFSMGSSTVIKSTIFCHTKLHQQFSTLV